jgi:hypothetical protein
VDLDGPVHGINHRFHGCRPDLSRNFGCNCNVGVSWSGSSDTSNTAKQPLAARSGLSIIQEPVKMLCLPDPSAKEDVVVSRLRENV